MSRWQIAGSDHGPDHPEYIQVVLVGAGDGEYLDQNQFDDLRARLNADVKAALEVCIRFGGIDGEHHKAWVIDQMVRALTGCPSVLDGKRDARGQWHHFMRLGESPEYLALVAEACAGDDGPNTYAWDEGIAP